MVVIFETSAMNVAQNQRILSNFPSFYSQINWKELPMKNSIFDSDLLCHFGVHRK